MRVVNTVVKVLVTIFQENKVLKCSFNYRSAFILMRIRMHFGICAHFEFNSSSFV